MKQETIKSIQEWLPIVQILENGIIKLKEENYIKIIKIIPVGYNLKLDLEKEAILNSYKTFLKTCNFNIQILIQSNKEDLKKHFFILEQEKKINKNKDNLYQAHINYLKKINSENSSSSKNFYIIIDQINNLKENPDNEIEKIITEKFC